MKKYRILIMVLSLFAVALQGCGQMSVTLNRRTSQTCSSNG